MRTRILVASVMVIALAGGCSATPASGPPTDAGSAMEWTAPGAAESASVSALPVEQVAEGIVSRAGEVIPPTNRWYSGLVFGAEPHRVFPFPLALDLDATSFAVSLPDVVASPTTVRADVRSSVTVAVPSDSFEVVRADPVAVTVRYSMDDAAVGDLTVAEGWPVAAFTAVADVALPLGQEWTEAAPGVWQARVDGQQFGLEAPDAELRDGRLQLRAGASAQWFAVPADSSLEAWAEALSAPVTDVETTYGLDQATASTRLTYTGTDATVLVPFPGRETGDCALGTFDTIFGAAAACATTSFSWSVPRIAPAAGYDLDALDDAARASLIAQTRDDLAATAPLPADTYFGGKGLARLAALLELARSLGDDEGASAAADRLWEELQPWVDPTACDTQGSGCFVYDDALRLVVGKAPSFGSEEGNDHHFHYGYFLAAAAALASERPELVDSLRPVVDILAADIAAGTRDGALGGLRVFDPYRGHSWASGLSPFVDGNNQESTSEAVAAWNGLALWAAATGDDDLAGTAEWLLSAEAAAAMDLWVEPDLSVVPEDYGHGIVSLTWSGKRDYATWFSAEPSAILGIQLIPLGPVSLEYLAGDPERIAANVAEAGGEGSYDRALGDQVLQYSALAGDDALDRADQAASDLPDDAIDDGSSRALILAWLAAVRLR